MTTSVTHTPKAGTLLTGAEYESANAHIVNIDGVVPVGGIIMWSGTIASIPATWALCDGTLNSPGPDLRDKFVVGARQDSGGVAKTNIEGALSQSATRTGASVADHTNLTHDGSVASHPDLTHAALSHAALTVVHADHSLASVSHTHASGADVSVPSGSFASTAAVSVPSGSFASHAAISIPSTTGASLANASRATRNSQSGVTITGTVTRSVVTTGGLLLTLLSSNLGGNAPSYASSADVSVPSHSHASAANGSAPSGTIASAANASAPSGTIASTAAASRPSATGSEPAVTVTHADHSLASVSHTHASGADVSVPSGSFASTAAVSVPSGSFASHAAISIPSTTGASLANASRATRNSQSGVTITGTVTRSVVTTGGLLLTLLSSNLGGNAPSYASSADVSVPSHSHASAANGSAPSGTIASAANASAPSGTIASTAAASRPSATGSEPAVTVTHADHSLASLSHQAIGTHANLSHAFTPPAGHGTAGTVTHSTVAIVPAYFALAFIQRMS